MSCTCTLPVLSTFALWNKYKFTKTIDFSTDLQRLILTMRLNCSPSHLRWRNLVQVKSIELRMHSFIPTTDLKFGATGESCQHGVTLHNTELTLPRMVTKWLHMVRIKQWSRPFSVNIFTMVATTPWGNKEARVLLWNTPCVGTPSTSSQTTPLALAKEQGTKRYMVYLQLSYV